MRSEELAGRVTVGTAHTLQGAERQVVLFSPVYGDNSDRASFVDGTLELMNVAVSRAKDLFIVFSGQQRWEDTGPVFGLVRQRAVLGPHWFSAADAEGLGSGEAVSFKWEKRPQPTPPVTKPAPVQQPPWTIQPPASSEPVEPEPKMVDRHEPGYLIATELVKQWKDKGLLPHDSMVKAQHLNVALLEAGLLSKDSEGWLPTAEGITIGIDLYQGGSGDRTYISPIYSPQAQDALGQMLELGLLSF